MCLFLSVLIGLGAGGAWGAEKKKKKTGHTVSKAAYEPLVEAQEALQAGSVSKARELLEGLRGKEKRLNPHEKALLYQSYGYLEAGEGNYKKASGHLETCLEQDALPDGAHTQTLYNLAQIYLASERYDDAVKTLARWFRAVEKPAPDAYYMLAVAFYQQERFDRAIKPAMLAVKRSKKPKEAWLQMLLSLQLDTKDFKAARPTLEQLTRRFPSKAYWLQLSALYGELGQEKKSLAALELLYTQDLLDDDDELRRLAQLYLYHEIPYRAALVMEKGMEDGVITRDTEAYELLANSWMRAREFDRAIDPLGKAAQHSSDGAMFLRLGQAHAEREEWSQAAGALRKALEKGGLDDVGSAHLLLGVASFNQEQFDTASTHFGRAARSEKTRDDALRWLQHVEKARSKARSG